MKRIATASFVLVALAAAGTGGYWAGLLGYAAPSLESFIAAWSQERTTLSKATGPVIYFRHPDGEPVYSANPRQTEDGRDFKAVHASEDVSFDSAAATASAEAVNTAGEKRVLYYRNPMGLADTSPVPKKDSMGMDYIPVYEGEEDDGSTVKVSTGKLQRTGVKTGAATRSVVVRPVRVPGTVQLDERRISVVSTRTEAFVEEVAQVTTGEVIAEGQPLVRFYSPEITAAGAQYATDLNNGPGGAAAGGSLQRLENLGVPAEAVAEIRKTRKVPITVTMTAPRGGVVLERMAVDGMKAEPGEALFRIADISTVWVVADVPEYELGSIRVGAEATIRIRSKPGMVLKGKVGLIYPQVDTQTRTTRVRIEVPNAERFLLADMYADVEIAAGKGEPVVTVPDSAVIDTGERQVVIIDKGEGSFEPREVKVGMRGQGMTEISEGVEEGEQVVTSANFLIDAESNLKAALSALTPAEAKP
ncbi:efflux RND transporter periplasmic adaptor subunit [Allomesorhizobium camelthorni]|uniref:Efflux RND transporter periplasmic adaptor subunit n=1 Tax=Allomesorhizobium camelthorni TaxID=475069 RepID=A0A6G4WKY4_9HYPH|nr:efflux RND transporter periplasmic adaptor subunit [Mesorhizobium camelthorni]NGO55284.1 efflux RND transporter periplasmic adaptor subunit [Mesorhizobium camelthorni]